MASNLCIRITSGDSLASDVLLQYFFACTAASGFCASEDESAISNRARRVGPNGHLSISLIKDNWHGGINVMFKFNDYASVNVITLEPAGRLMAGMTSYSEQNAACLASLYRLTKCLYEKFDANEAIALLDDVDEPWFRLSKSESTIPLPSLPVSSTD